LTELSVSGLEVFRRPFHGVAILKMHKVEDSSVKRGILIALSGALALYSVTYPDMLLESLAMMGVGACVIRNPTFFAPKLSVRGVTLVLALLPTLAIIVSSIMCLVMGHSKQNPTPSWMNPWLLSAFQFWGIGSAGVLTALILRYEHSISDSSDQPPPAIENPPLVGSTVTLRGFPREAAFGARVTVAGDRPEFPRPLFRTLMFLSFLVHAPAASLVLGPELWAPMLEHVPVWARTCGELVVIFPAQLWAAFVLPIAVGVACLLRADGAQLWRYTELWIRPTLQTTGLDNAVAVEKPQHHPAEVNIEKV